MNRWRAPLLVGLVGIAGVVAFVLLFGTVRQDVVREGEGYRVYADFEDVSGLAASSRVTIAGVPVGTMERFDLVTGTDGGTRARVWIRMGADIALYRGTPGPGGTMLNAATITRRAATMLGDYYLEIAPGLGGERLRDGDAIPNVVGDAGLMAIAKKLEDASDIFPRIQQIADDIHVVTASLSAVVGGVEGEARIRKIVDDVVLSAEQIAGAAADVRAFVGQELGSEGQRGRFGRIVANVEQFTSDASRLTRGSADDLARTIANIEAITSDLRDVLAKPASEGGDPGRLDRAMERIEASLENLERATGAVARIAETIDRGEGSLGKLVKEDTVVEKAEVVIDDLGDLVSSVSRLKTEVGFRSEFNVFQRALKNYLSLRFVPDKTKYYLIELVWDPRGKTS
ncbi:MAG TPA: MlaD family protein, partial [Myxococcota bacterium]|nr:MlaD family protein [Myxococcota bacterium]